MKEETSTKGMDFSIARDILRDAVRIVSASVSTKSSTWMQSQQTGNLLIIAGDDGLELRAADIEASVSLNVQGALVTETGKSVVPLVLLKDLIETFPSGGRVDVSSNDKGTIVKCGRSESTLAAKFEPDAFPLTAEPDDDGISLKREALIEIAGQVAVAASTDDSRPALTGVCFDFSSEGLTLAAADGFRLAARSLPLETKSEQEEQIVIPVSSLKRLLTVLGKMDDETITLHVEDEGRRVVFHNDRFQMTTQTIAHPFPKWEQIVPKSYEASMSIGNTALSLALKQARLFPRAGREAPVVKIEFLNSAKNVLRVRANTAETGDYTGDLPVLNVENEPVTFGVNSKFLLEMLPRLGEAVQIKTNKASDPIVLMNGELTYVVMPVTLRE